MKYSNWQRQSFPKKTKRKNSKWIEILCHRREPNVQFPQEQCNSSPNEQRRKLQKLLICFAEQEILQSLTQQNCVAVFLKTISGNEILERFDNLCQINELTSRFRNSVVTAYRGEKEEDLEWVENLCETSVANTKQPD